MQTADQFRLCLALAEVTAESRLFFGVLKNRMLGASDDSPELQIFDEAAGSSPAH